MKNKEKLTFKRWNQFTKTEKVIAKSKLRSFQKGDDCEYGFNSKGEIVKVLDCKVLMNIFGI